MIEGRARRRRRHTQPDVLAIVENAHEVADARTAAGQVLRGAVDDRTGGGADGVYDKGTLPVGRRGHVALQLEAEIGDARPFLSLNRPHIANPDGELRPERRTGDLLADLVRAVAQDEIEEIPGALTWRIGLGPIARVRPAPQHRCVTVHGVERFAAA